VKSSAAALVLTTVLLLALLPSGAAAQTTANPTVEAWIEVELAAIASHRTNPPRAARGLALVSVAMHDAATEAPHAREAAIAGAASIVLAYLYPDESERFLALGAGGSELGRRIGRRLVRRGQTDGSDAVWTGTVPVGPGLWVPTPPLFAPPLEPLAGTWRPWNLESGSQFRPSPPPRPGSLRYALELLEVYAVSLSLSDEQRRIADSWADGPGTVTPPGHWNQIALELVRANGLSTQGTARIFAVLNTAQADAFIACWDTKFTYWSERPVTAIRRLLDPNWLSYIATPPFPGYVSGHSSTSGAASEVLADFFPGEATRLRALAEEAAVSRLYGGIHFRNDNEAGLKLGREVAARTLAVRG
jgi:PAP2 superfamily